MEEQDTQTLIQPSDTRFVQRFLAEYYALAPFDSSTHPNRDALDFDYQHAARLIKESIQHPKSSKFQNTTLYCLSRLIYNNPDVAYYVPDKKNPKDLLHLAIETDNPDTVTAVLRFKHKSWICPLKDKKQLNMALMAFAARRETFKLGMMLVYAGASFSFVPNYRAMGLKDTGDNALMYYFKSPSTRHYAKRLPLPTVYDFHKDIALLTHKDSTGETLFSMACKNGYPNDVKNLCDIIRSLPNETDYKTAINLDKSIPYLEKRLDRLNVFEDDATVKDLSYALCMARYRNIPCPQPAAKQSRSQTPDKGNNPPKNVEQDKFNFDAPVMPRIVAKAAINPHVQEELIDAYLPGLEPA